MQGKRFALLSVALLLGCGQRQNVPPPVAPGVGQATGQAPSLLEARKGFQTKLTRQVAAREPVPEPPASVFQTVRFDSPVGKLAAYLSPDPKDGKKHPAIIWITGGDCNTIGDVWSEMPAGNDQTASAFRKAGILMMYPSLRGGNDNPGAKESFLGEVDDILAARDYLASQSYVDPQRIYLGGHSTGGTLVLLVAASTDKFRAVFSFGPADNVGGYGPEYLFFNTADKRELDLRSPGQWINSIQSPTFVFEGTSQGNLASLKTMAASSKNAKVRFHPVDGADHFSVLFPITTLAAGKILKDESSPSTNLAFTEDEFRRAMGR